MKKIFIMFIFILFRPTMGLAQEGEGKASQVCYYHDHGASPVETMNLYNMVANALSYGVVTNGIRNGSGITDPVAASRGVPAPTTEGPYYQALHLLSLVDWDLGRALRYDKHFRPLPQDVWLGMGPMDSAKTSLLGGERIVSSTLPVPHLPSLELRHLETDAPADREKLRQAILVGVRDQLRKASKNDLGMKGDMAAPAGMTVDMKFPKNAKGTKVRAEFILPPFFHAERDGSFRLKKGFPQQDLPGGPLVTYLATLDQIGYLDRDPDEKVDHAVKVELAKNFTEAEKNKLKVRLAFGRLVDGAKGVSFVHGDPADSLRMKGKFIWQINGNDNYLYKKFKHWFNRRMEPFELEARFHQVTLELSRQGEKTLELEAARDHRMEPHRFVMDETHISYVLRRNQADPATARELKATGFTCLHAEDGHHYNCHQDFATWKDMEKGFLRRGILVKLAAWITNWDLVKSLPDLQEKMDHDLEARFNLLLDQGMVWRKEMLAQMRELLKEEKEVEANAEAEE